jgi:hypothetical protein
MAEVNTQKLEQPPSASPSPGVQARVFSMPERYRHGAEAKMHDPRINPPTVAPVEVKTPAIPAPKAPPKPPVHKKSSSTRRLLVIGVTVLLLLGVGGFFLVQFTSKPSVTPSTTTASPVSRPAPVTKPEPEPEPESEPVTESEEEIEVFPTTILPGTDSDSDGLTDTEEEQIYGTDPKRPDTDADGFLDGNEVFHGYNPGGTAPGTLIESKLVEAATGTLGGITYTFFYPSAWELEQENDELLLDAQTGEGFRVTLDIGELSQGDARTTKTGLSYILSDDQLTASVEIGTGLLVINYDTGVKARVDYLQTFQMMLNSVTYDTSTTESGDTQGGTEAPNETVTESP